MLGGENRGDMKSFALQLWIRVLAILRKISWLELIGLFPGAKDEDGYHVKTCIVDAYVHFLPALAFILLLSHQAEWSGRSPASWILLTFVSVRLLELVVFHLSLLIVTADTRNLLKVGVKVRHAPERPLILSLLNYFEVSLWFALLYRLFRADFYDMDGALSSWCGTLYYSVITQTTLGYGDIRPDTTSGYILATLHVLIGLFIVLLVIARLLTVLPRLGQDSNEAEPGEPKPPNNADAGDA